MSNFVRKFSLEFCQKFLNFFRENYYSKKFPRVFLDFSEKIITEKVSSRTKLRRCIYAFFVDQLACVCKRNVENRRSLHCRGGAPPNMR